MRYRKLDADGDMQFGHGPGDFWKDQPEAVGQSIKTRLLLFTGEWFLDVTAGTPWGGFPLNTEVVRRGRILAQHTQLSRDAAIRDRIISTEGVATLAVYGSAFDPNSRGFTVNATVDTIYGGQVHLSIVTPPTASEGTPPTVRVATPAYAAPKRVLPPVLRALPRR